MQLKNRPQANRSALAPFAHFLGLPSVSNARSSASQSNAHQLQERLAPAARFLDVASSALSAVDGRLISGSTTKRHELPTAATSHPKALQGNAHKPQIISRRVAPGVTVQSSARNSRPASTARVSEPISQTPFEDAMRGYLAPTTPESMTTRTAALVDRPTATATYADAQAASRRLHSLRKALSDKIFEATLSGQRAKPAELNYLRRQIERAEAEHKAIGQAAAEADQRALANKSSAVRAALVFPKGD